MKKSRVGDLKVNFLKLPLTVVTLMWFFIHMKEIHFGYNIFGNIKSKLLRQENTTGSASN